MPAQLQKDAFLVFRALCKLSIRSTETAPGSEITTVRGKVLALELLKILLENSGPLFRSTERFVSAIKQYLCLSLLKNCQSAVPAALRLCCSIFLTLMTKFRKNLKAEIGVFFPMILLRPIEPAVTGATPNAGGERAPRRARLPPARAFPLASTAVSASWSVLGRLTCCTLRALPCRRGRRPPRPRGHRAQGGGAALPAGSVRGRPAAGGPVCQLRLRPGGGQPV
jgi:hypothetical protein